MDGSGGGKATGADLTITIALPNGVRLSAEDVALLEAIRRVRSITGAAKALGISYRKAWLMVDALARGFESPAVTTHPGRRDGGSELTPFGERLIALYRSVERRSRSAAGAALGELVAGLDWSFRVEGADADLTARAATDEA
jgi:molybdate transport system regulatory protein